MYATPTATAAFSRNSTMPQANLYARVGVETAIGVAAKMVREDLTRRISEDLGNFEAQAA